MRFLGVIFGDQAVQEIIAYAFFCGASVVAFAKFLEHAFTFLFVYFHVLSKCGHVCSLVVGVLVLLHNRDFKSMISANLNNSMAKNKKQPPALKQVYWTAELRKVAIARLQGGISWAELIQVEPDQLPQPGVLLFDTLEAAHAYIARSREDFAVVVELPVTAIQKQLLVRCQEFVNTDLEFRQWIYPHHIWFDSVRFHKFSTVAQEVDPAELASPVRAEVIASSRRPGVTITPDGTITIPAEH